MKSFAILGWFGIPHKTHYEIGKYLSKRGKVYFGIVRFFNKGKEVITRSRPLYGHERRSVIESWGFETFYWDFYNPYLKYFLPNYAMKMREDILNQLPEDTVFYTRSPYAASVLKLLGLCVEYSPRSGISGSSIREKLYDGKKVEGMPPETLLLLDKVSSRLEMFAKEKDRTIKLYGFKIPLEGFLK